MESTVSQINNLIKSGQDLSQDTIGVFNTNGKLKTFDISFDKLKLTDKAKIALSRKADSVVVQWNEKTKDAHSKHYEEGSPLKDLLHLLQFFGTAKDMGFFFTNQATYIRCAAMCQYFAITSPPSRMRETADRLTEIINEMAEADQIRSSLAPMTMLPMADGRIAFLSYLHIMPVHVAAIETKYAKYLMAEGGIPTKIEDL